MADVNFYLKDPKSKEKTLIYLFFSFDGNRMKYSTGEFIKPSSWNSEKQRARFSTVGATDINNRLIKLDEDINKIIDTYYKRDKDDKWKLDEKYHDRLDKTLSNYFKTGLLCEYYSSDVLLRKSEIHKILDKFRKEVKW